MFLHFCADMAQKWRLNKHSMIVKQKIKTKEAILLILIISLTIALVFISNATNGMIVFNRLSESINKQIVYQSITIFVTTVFLMILFFHKKEEFQRYFCKGNISAEIIPQPIVGIKPNPKENWSHLGRNFAIVISVITGILVYFQVIKGSEVTFTDVLNVLPFSILFALSNSFVEEMITRFGVVVVLKNTINDKIIPIISALIFGTVHYWGNPGGFFGVIAAGFLAWLLAKSIIETKGVFWAWLIHFLQDVIIFSALLALS